MQKDKQSIVSLLNTYRTNKRAAQSQEANLRFEELQGIADRFSPKDMVVRQERPHYVDRDGPHASFALSTGVFPMSFNLLLEDEASLSLWVFDRPAQEWQQVTSLPRQLSDDQFAEALDNYLSSPTGVENCGLGA